MQATLDNIPEDQLLTEIERLKPEVTKKLNRFPNVPGVQGAMDFSDIMVDAITIQEKTS
ncbi:MAG: hypothetical protein MUO40_04510 [Anaerolineaceae bacterium]|nr:hypothetical protein [Anaerolineaceae bacterium]